MKRVSLLTICCLFVVSCTPSATVEDQADLEPVAAAPEPPSIATTISSDVEEPWDYSPYRVLIWLVTDNPAINVQSLDEPLRKYLDRDFAAVWRTDFAAAPAAVASIAIRDIASLSYDRITSADPVLAVKRDHKDAVRIRIAENVGQYVTKMYGTQGRIDEVKQRALAAGDETIAGVAERLEPVDGDATAVGELWADTETEGLLVSRGMAQTLTDPAAKLIKPPITNLVADAVEKYDKIFVVLVGQKAIPKQISVVELDTLMHHFGPVAKVPWTSLASLPISIGRALTKAFAPVVRIDNAGQRNATGMLRARGLIVDKDSPATIKVNDVLQPMTRKNDRNGRPILIGPVDWAFLLVREFQGRNTKMDFYAGRAGGLQGRKNKRTFRTALKVRPFGDSSLLRLHLQREPTFPLIGYELYEKDLESSDMTFVGRTDWGGRLLVPRTEDPFRLLYVKNGGAVLARLPIVPGLHEIDVADLSGDDMRLQAEAYIRGVQNSIIDLVAIRELFRARIRLRLERGEMDKAETLMNALREQPSNEKLANEISKRQTDFLKALGNRNANQRRKVDEMFTTTRELLSTHIHPRMINELEDLMIAAQKNGGKLPPMEVEEQESQPSPEPETTD